MERGEDTVRAFTVTGQVQGVGFRPFVYRLARRLGLSGFVRNAADGVRVEVSGPDAGLEDFRRGLAEEAPALSRLESIRPIQVSGRRWVGFHILVSDDGARDRGRVTVDTATCPACAVEMRDPEDRRHGHGLINCTDCGPRYSIVTGLPYDRPLTTMAGFALCDECAREYGDPEDRRFHAQPVCCPRCGPRVRFEDASGGEPAGDPVALAAEALRAGGILLMKGLGGYHLAVDAGDELAVRRLRALKGRDAKPLALLVRDLAAAGGLAELSSSAKGRLTSPVAPILLAPRRPEAAVAESVAPKSRYLGVMLPNTPLQHLLAEAFGAPLVLTSANRSEDPLLADDVEARCAFGRVVAGTLTHDRPIHRALDDSVELDSPRGVLPVRRARGHVPAPLDLPVPASAPGLATGGDLKATVAVVTGGAAVLSQHLGDLSYTEALVRFRETVDDLTGLFAVTPAWVAHDLHPQYLSRRFALDLAARTGIRAVGVQHHHAHLASLLAEHDRVERTIGIVCDGVGYGADGGAWGGEVLVGDLTGFERRGHLRPLRLPGGDAAAVDTARCAISWLRDAGVPAHPLAAERPEIALLLAGGLQCPESTGAGRLFDAAAVLTGLALANRYEAESGMALEDAAVRAGGGPSGAGLLPLVGGGPFVIDHRPLVAALLAEDDPGAAAWLFHDALADGLARGARRAAEATGIDTVGLSGGVFMNALLTDLVAARLEEAGLSVLLHREVPPNDGGLALGQAAVAAARLAAGEV